MQYSQLQFFDEGRFQSGCFWRVGCDDDRQYDFCDLSNQLISFHINLDF